MIQNSKFSKEYLEKFLETAIERHRIYLKKEQGIPRPWTEDKVMDSLFFCNLFRQYDKCSKWMIENIIPLRRWDLIIVFRFISTYELYLEIEKNCDIKSLDSIRNFLEVKYNNKEKLFTGCFIRNPRAGQGWGTPAYQAPFFLIEELKKDGTNFLQEFQTLDDMCNYLQLFPGVGGFMSYEYACDFEYMDDWNPTDKHSWANRGPGAKQGMGLVMAGNRTLPHSEQAWLEHAIELKGWLQLEFNKAFPTSEDEITLREVEHWLCEFQKYVKYVTMLNTGKRVKHRKY